MAILGSLVAARITHSKKYNQRRANAAAAERVAGLREAEGKITEAQGGLKGYRDYGNLSLQRQERLFNDPSYLENTGGYKFAMDQGLKGTTAARSRSSIFSGETLKALTEYASGLASQTYDAEWKRLQAGVQTGFAAEQQYGNLATTSAEISAGVGEARARSQDQMAAWYAGQEGFGRQIAGQWSGAFAGMTTSKMGGGGGG